MHNIAISFGCPIRHNYMYNTTFTVSVDLHFEGKGQCSHFLYENYFCFHDTYLLRYPFLEMNYFLHKICKCKSLKRSHSFNHHKYLEFPGFMVNKRGQGTSSKIKNHLPCVRTLTPNIAPQRCYKSYV